MNGSGRLTASLNGVQTGLMDKAELERRPEEMAEQAVHLSGENVCGQKGQQVAKALWHSKEADLPGERGPWGS